MSRNKCYYCDRAFNIGDDVVFCPSCGEKYHESCYEEHGCINPQCDAGVADFYKMQNSLQDLEDKLTGSQEGEEIEYISTDNLKVKRYVTLISLCSAILLAILGAISIGIACVFGKGIMFGLFLMVGILLFVATIIAFVVMVIFFNLSIGVTITSRRVIIEDPFEMEKSIPLDLITSSTGKPGLVKFFVINTASSIPNIILFHSQSMNYHYVLRDLIAERKSNKQ